MGLAGSAGPVRRNLHRPVAFLAVNVCLLQSYGGWFRMAAGHIDVVAKRRRRRCADTVGTSATSRQSGWITDAPKNDCPHRPGELHGAERSIEHGALVFRCTLSVG